MKHDSVLELYYGGDWHDITADDRVLSRNPITITRGRNDARKRVTRSTLSATLASSDGRFYPRNAASPLYGLIGPNTPIRHSVRVLRDRFTRTVADGWGSVDTTGEAWSNGWVGGSGADFDVAAGVGTHLVSGANQARVSGLSTVQLRDVEAFVTVSGLPANVTGADLNTILLLRSQGDGETYVCVVRITTAEAIQLEVWHATSGGVWSSIGLTTVPGLTHTGAAMRFGASIEGQVIRMKAWLVASGEPFDWQLVVTDDQISAAGSVGIRSGASSGNTNVPVTFAYDDFDVRLPRFHGEVEQWPQRRAVRGSAWVPIEATGIMRRLSAPGTKARAASALVRAVLLTMAPLGYWPMEDGSAASVAASALPAVPALAVQGAVDFAASDGPPGSRPLCGNLTADEGALRVPDVVPDGTQTWQFGMVFKADAAQSAILIEWYDDTDAVTPYWNIQYSEEGSGLIVSAYDALGALTIVGALDLAVGEWHSMVWRQESDGSRTLYADGVANPASGGDEGVSGPPRNVTLAPYRPDLFLGEAISIGHFMIWADISVDPADIHTAMLGHVGETAAERIERLCDQDGIPVTVIGDGAALVGPQLPKPTLELLFDAAEADEGILFEPRGALGLAYRTRVTLENQAAVITADFAAGDEVAPPMEPIEDTDAIANDVTVIRHNGSSARSVQLTGPRNINDPQDDPQGVGQGYAVEYTRVLYEDTQCGPLASWLLHVGTWDEERYPLVPFDLTAMAVAGKAALLADAAALNVGDRLAVTNHPDRAETIDQLAQGFRETVGSHHWEIDVTATPARPWTVGVYDEDDRYDTAGCETTAEFDAGTDTSLAVLTTLGQSWTTDADDWPFEIRVSGVVLEVTAVTGAGTSQTLTVTAAPVNGVQKTIGAGAAVELARPSYYAL